MSAVPPTLHMVCGKIASGKSTLTAKLGRRENTVLVSEDDWLATIYAEEMVSIADFVRCAARLRKVMGPHVVSMLNAGVSVVLDFQANTIEARKWMRGILDQTDASHILHVLDVPDETCLERLRSRNARGEHPFAVTEEQFRQVSGRFVMPSPEEGFNILRHGD